MITFTKLRDPNNSFDLTDITIAVSSDSTAPEVCEAFRSFLLACGYSAKTIATYLNEVALEEDFTRKINS